MDLRSKICIWIIVLGLANFVAYSVVYMFLGGEALSGVIKHDASGKPSFYLKSPRPSDNGSSYDVPTSRGVFIYSGIHSLSIWLTMAAVMLAMLTMAKERIVSDMRMAIVRGRTLITILATLIVFITLILMVWYGLQFASRFSPPRHLPTTQVAARPAHALAGAAVEGIAARFDGGLSVRRCSGRPAPMNSYSVERASRGLALGFRGDAGARDLPGIQPVTRWI